MPPLAAFVPAIVGGIGAGASIYGAKKQASAADRAAQRQAEATKYAADLNQKAMEESNALYGRLYGENAALIDPWMKPGLGAYEQLAEMAKPGGKFMEEFDPFNFQFRTEAGPGDEGGVVDPSYQWRLDQGNQALERSAAAKTGVLGGATAKALTNYAQGAASQEYQNQYGRAFNSYLANRDTFQQNRANQFGTLSYLAGVGQNATGARVGLGERYGSNVSGNVMSNARYAGDMAMQGANARAAGDIARGNIWGQTIGGLGNMGMGIGLGMATGAIRNPFVRNNPTQVSNKKVTGNSGYWYDELG